MSTKTFYTTYKAAVNWLNNSFILCNNIVDIDSTIWENMIFNCYDEDDNPIDIFQWYITDCSQSDVEYLTKYFDLKFT